MTQLADLHLHSYFSDGVDSPTDLVIQAKERNLKAIALTDHNTVGGLSEFRNACIEYNIEYSCGTEITCDYKGSELHILGHFIPEASMLRLDGFLREQVEKKDAVNLKCIKALMDDGYPVSPEEFDKIPHEGTRNRKHIAAYLHKKGVVKSEAEAWRTFLADDSKYYFKTEKLKALEVIAVLRKLGAVPVIAHPLRLDSEERAGKKDNLPLSCLGEFLNEATAAGLLGIETRHSNTSPERTLLLENAASEHGLLCSGGSDYHGFFAEGKKAGLEMGCGYVPEISEEEKFGIAVPYEYFVKMRDLSVKQAIITLK